MWLRIVIGFTFISKLQGFADGNFPQSCASMSPDHTRGGTQLRPQTSEPPYEVTCQNGHPGEPIKVSLRSIGTQSFRGFMLQARDVSYGAEGRTVGRFSSIETSTIRLLSCDGSTDSAVSHGNNRQKTSVNVAWTPQGEQGLNIIFRATFAEGFQKFWERVNVTLAQCTTSPTMEPTSTQETIASTSTQETTASTSTQETIASTSTQVTTVLTPKPETTASTSTQETIASTSTANTTGPPPPEQFRTEEATLVMCSKSAWKAVQKATHNIVFFTSPQNRPCFKKVLMCILSFVGFIFDISSLGLVREASSYSVPLVALGSVVLAISSLELVINIALLLMGPSHELKASFESALRVCFAIDPIFTMPFIFTGVFLLTEEEKRKRTSIHPLLLPLLCACTIWIFLAEIWGFGLCCNRGPILRRVKKESSTHPENCQPQSTENPFCKVKWFVQAVSVIFMAGTLCFAVAIIVIMM